MSDAPIGRPEDVVATFVEAWNRCDPDVLATLFDSDAEFVNVTGLWWHTREEIRKAHAYGLTRIFKESVPHSDRRPRQIAQPKLHQIGSLVTILAFARRYGIELVTVRPPLSMYAHGY